MKRNSSTFYCFSPPVMMATFAIEIILLLYILIRYKMNPVTRLVGGLLALLAIFQYAEFHVCESIGTTDFYSRLGFVAITFLPPVGLHLVTKLARKESPRLVGTAYGTGILFAMTFAFSPSAFNSYACAGNYAVFHLMPGLGGLYWVYYFSWIFIGIGMCLKFGRKAEKRMRHTLALQATGYLSFILPTAIVNFLNPTTMEGLPSIMCGFAVLYALMLGFGIAPRVLKQKNSGRLFSFK